MENKNEITNRQFEQTIAECRSLFEKKLHDYGASWRILRPQSLTDQLFIKAKRIRSLEIKKESLVGEGIRPEFIALINYGIVGLIQLANGFSDTVDITAEEAEGALTFVITTKATEGGNEVTKYLKADGTLSDTEAALTLKDFDHEEARLRRGLARYEGQFLYRLHPHQDRAYQGD